MYLLPTSIPFSLNKYTLSHTLIAQTRTKATDMFISYVFPIGNTKYHTRSSDYPTIGTLTYSTEDTLDHFEICFMLLVALNGYFINRTIIYFFWFLFFLVQFWTISIKELVSLVLGENWRSGWSVTFRAPVNSSRWNGSIPSS